MTLLRIPKPPRAAVFDLDGTLVDSAPDLAAATNRLLQGIGRTPLPLSAVHGMIGEGVTVLLERALAATGGWPNEAEFKALLVRFRADYEAHVADATRPYPGAAETLHRLRAAGLRIALCTNKPRAPAEALLRALGAEGWFDAVIAGEGGRLKPHPQPVHDALAALGVAAPAAVYVGDSAIDLMAARQAGVAVVLVTYGYTKTPAVELGAEATIDALGELPALLGLGG